MFIIDAYCGLILCTALYCIALWFDVYCDVAQYGVICCITALTILLFIALFFMSYIYVLYTDDDSYCDNVSVGVSVSDMND